jgi:hypothetical protein
MALMIAVARCGQQWSRLSTFQFFKRRRRAATTRRHDPLRLLAPPHDAMARPITHLTLPRPEPWG